MLLSGWSQTQAARELKVPQPTISKIVNGNIDKLSIEFLVKLTVRAGIPVHVSSGNAPGATGMSRRERNESFSKVIRRLFAERPALTAGELLEAMNAFEGKGGGQQRKRPRRAAA